MQSTDQAGRAFTATGRVPLGLDEIHLPALANAMQRQYVFGKIAADCNYIRGLTLSNE